MINTTTHQLKDGTQITIREAQTTDAQAVIDYLDAVVGETDFLTFGPGEFGYTVDAEVSYIEKMRAADNCLMLVAIVDGRIVGICGFNGAPRSRVHHQGEMGITVLRRYWGLGIGTRLIESLIAWAKAGGVVRKINLRTREDNRRAIALYKRLGFVVQGTLTREFLVDGQFYSSMAMGLELD
jgi:RimJ/RimL family protein N-acetyltransferase